MLFEVTGIPLHRQLLEAGCGVDVHVPHSGIMRVVVVMIVDDIVLPCGSAYELSQALLIADRWASLMRIRWNIGTGKSAYMAWGLGPLSIAEESVRIALRKGLLPRVKIYKYGGVVVSSGGGWGHQLAYVRKRTLSKTRALSAWGRRLQVTVDILERIWRIYVERSALFGMGFPQLPDSALATLDRIQRVAGRLLLGYASRCPTPVIVAELGWTRWSVALVGERVGLLRRVLTTKSQYCTGILEASSLLDSSWVHMVAAEVRPWCEDGLPQSASGWTKLRRGCIAEARRCDCEEIYVECLQHQRLRHYRPVCWEVDGSWRPNPSLHNKRVPAQEARVVGRWLAGGQESRAGDVDEGACATPRNCCIPCLTSGHKVVDTLHHALLACPHTAVARAEAAEKGVVLTSCRDLSTPGLLDLDTNEEHSTVPPGRHGTSSGCPATPLQAYDWHLRGGFMERRGLRGEWRGRGRGLGPGTQPWPRRWLRGEKLSGINITFRF